MHARSASTAATTPDMSPGPLAAQQEIFQELLKEMRDIRKEGAVDEADHERANDKVNALAGTEFKQTVPVLKDSDRLRPALAAVHGCLGLPQLWPHGAPSAGCSRDLPPMFAGREHAPADL